MGFQRDAFRGVTCTTLWQGCPVDCAGVIFDRFLNLLHQVIVLFTLNHNMRGCTKIDRLDQIVIDVGIDSRLQKRYRAQHLQTHHE